MEFNEIRCNTRGEEEKKGEEAVGEGDADLRNTQLKHDLKLLLKNNATKIGILKRVLFKDGKRTRSLQELLSRPETPGLVCRIPISSSTVEEDPIPENEPKTPLSQLDVKNIPIRPVKSYTLQSLKKTEPKGDPKILFSKQFIENEPTDEKLFYSNKRIFLYKTELCRSFSELGVCKYGDRCQFSHSSVELRDVHRHPKYKTETCRVFWEKGTCPYGKRCCFLHSTTDMDKDEPFVVRQQTFLTLVSRFVSDGSADSKEPDLYSRAELVNSSVPYFKSNKLRVGFTGNRIDDEIEMGPIQQKETPLLGRILGISDLTDKIKHRYEYREADYEYKRNVDRIGFNVL
ncbi:TIS1 [Enterospora canceri]|uniref:TIS1 n=1 Tax=Enterospora canceri TaxID=1081671 RepID=A0A1Y1S810_9MICR|nr:TIS1 [Enterospora canceri]